MGYPRRLTVPPGVPGIYHCTSRCVRRAFLCGEDPVTGQCFDHRKQWLEDRLLALAEVFAVAVHAYAIMSNHFHAVIETDPEAPEGWSDEEVARRWLSLSARKQDTDLPMELRVAALIEHPERLAVLRERLGSLSWFMSYLKEPIARRANREDGCTGRFWEGRFDTQALLDDPALLGCMVYVDLNPVRAGTVREPEQGLHTSVRRRVFGRRHDRELMAPLAASIPSRALTVTTAQYLDLVNWTGRALHSPHETSELPQTPPLLERLAVRPGQWLIQVPATESGYWRAIGCAESLLAHAERIGVRWLRGIGIARSLGPPPAPT